MYISAIDIRTKVSYLFIAWEIHIMLQGKLFLKKIICIHMYN